MGKTKFISTVIFMLLSLTISFSGCSCLKNNKSFFVITNGTFHTDDVKLAQAEVPFTIILPKYLPESVNRDYRYLISGPVKKDNISVVQIDIEYRKGDEIIDITEINIKENWVGNEDLYPIYLDIDGIQVLRQNYNSFSSSGTIKGFMFNWSQNELSFRVGIYSFSEDESFKIVESMIKQMTNN